MSASLNSVMDALLTTLGNAYSFKVESRRLRDPENVASDERPALFVVNTKVNFFRESANLPARREVECFAIIYTDVGNADPNDLNAIPEVEVNTIVDAFTAALGPDPTEDGFQTLGGLVYSCIIDGEVLISSGETDGKMVFAVPIHIIIDK